MSLDGGKVLRLTRWCINHRYVIVGIWVVLLVVALAVSRVVGSNYGNNFSLPNTGSQKAADLLQNDFPSRDGDTDEIVIHARKGTVQDTDIQASVEPMLKRVAALPYVSNVVSPYSPLGSKAVSPDGTIAFATVTFSTNADSLPLDAVERVITTAQAVDSGNLQVELGGFAVERAQSMAFGSLTVIGIVAAMFVLFITFGSLLAMGMPIVIALFGLGTGVGLIIIGSQVIDMANYSEELALMIGLGVGVDYALFIVSRYRDAYRDNGGNVRAAAELAMDTSGRAVLFAGTTVVVALMGLFALRLDFLYGIALASSIAVLLVLAASLTLLPAFLIFSGHQLGKGSITSRLSNKRRARSKQATQQIAPAQNTDSIGKTDTSRQTGAQSHSRFGESWIRSIQRHPWITGIAAATLMLVLAAPALSMRLGLSDARNDAPITTTRRAYDLLAEGFGPGFNGPLIVVAELAKPGDRAPLAKLAAELGKSDGVAAITPPQFSPNGDVATMTVFPTSAPQDAATTTLVNHLRDDVTGPIAAQTGSQIYIGGPTAVGIDFSQVIAGKLWLFIAVVVLLSALLLLMVFRSLIIPIQAAVMNLLSIGASMGIAVALFQFGWFNGITGIGTGPIEAWLPVMVFAIVFGLSMDYEVFLVSRIREEWLRSGSPSEAVHRGLLSTGRVITAAAAVMVVVFASFISGGERVIALFGVALASAVLLDAVVIRCILLPAVLQICGGKTWVFPAWLGWIPRVRIEGQTALEPQTRRQTDPEREPVGSSTRPDRGDTRVKAKWS